MQDHITALQQVKQWNKGEQQDAEMRPTTKNSNTLSTKQQEDIDITLGDLKAQQQAAEAQKVKSLMSFTDMTATCRATEDIYLEAGERCEHAIMTSVDLPPEKVHCAMIFEAQGTVAAPQIDTSDNREEDAEWLDDSDEEQVPELLSESDSTSDSGSESESDDDTSMLCHLHSEADRPIQTQSSSKRQRHRQAVKKVHQDRKRQQAASWHAYRAARKAQAAQRSS